MNLPMDMLTEILIRLPVKSLIRFRCVCKSWHALIRSPKFMALHTNNINNGGEYLLIMRYFKDGNKNILSFHSNDDLLDIVAPDLMVPIFGHIDLVLIGSCNGIVCIMDREDIYLCNPAMREFRRIPKCPFECPQGFYKGSCYSGFGYDPDTNDYKIIRLVMLQHVKFHNTYIFRTEIFNLITNSWRELDNIPVEYLFDGSTSISFKGSLHWPIFDRILCFHINSEVFREMEYPEAGVTRGGNHSLAVLEESLALITCVFETEFPTPERNKFIDVWIMKEYGVKRSWMKGYSIGPLPRVNIPLSLRNNNGELFLESMDGQLISWVLSNGDQELRKYHVHGHPSYGCPPLMKVLTYRESLVSIKEYNQQ